MFAGGSDPMSAIGSVYHFTSKESARQFLYHFWKPPMKAVLRELYGEARQGRFFAGCGSRTRNPKVTHAQVEAFADLRNCARILATGHDAPE